MPKNEILQQAGAGIRCQQADGNPQPHGEQSLHDGAPSDPRSLGPQRNANPDLLATLGDHLGGDAVDTDGLQPQTEQSEQGRHESCVPHRAVDHIRHQARPQQRNLGVHGPGSGGDRRVRAEAALPQPMTENDRLGGGVVVVNEGPPKCRLRPEHVEVIPVDARTANLFGLPSVGEQEERSRPGGKAFEHIRTFGQRLRFVGVQEEQLVGERTDQAIAGGGRKRLHENRVDDREYRRVHAEPPGEREDRRRREARATPDQPERMAYIPPDPTAIAATGPPPDENPRRREQHSPPVPEAGPERPAHASYEACVFLVEVTGYRAGVGVGGW